MKNLFKYAALILLYLLLGTKTKAQFPPYMDWNVAPKVTILSPYATLVNKSGTGIEAFYIDSNWYMRTRTNGSIDANGNYTFISTDIYDSINDLFRTKLGYVQSLTYATPSSSGVKFVSKRNIESFDSLGRFARSTGNLFTSGATGVKMIQTDSIFRPSLSVSTLIDSLIFDLTTNKLVKRVFVNTTLSGNVTAYKRNLYAYNPYDDIDSLIEQYSNVLPPAAPVWIGSKRTKYLYFLNGSAGMTINTILTDTFKNGTWSRMKADSFYFNAAGKCSRYVSYAINGSTLTGLDNQAFTYPGTDSIWMIRQVWNGTGWTNKDKSLLLLMNGNLLSAQIYAWTGSTWTTANDHVINWVPLLISTGQKEVAAEQPKFYPNPIKDKFTLTGFGEFAKVYITDLKGVQHLFTPVYSNETELDISSLASGLYLLHVQCSDKIYTKRLLKE